MLIDKPGFYASKAGKCEVVAVRETSGGLSAIGFCAHGDASVWDAHDGGMVHVARDYSSCHITGPWVEPRKPVEAWVVCGGGGKYPYGDATEAERAFGFWLKHDTDARLIRLIEAPEEK